jgi:hypothetical protein
MSNPNIAERIHPLLDDESIRDFLQTCLSDIRSNVKDAQAEVCTLLVSVLVLLTLFELLLHSAISELNFGPVKISDLALVIKTLPLLIAFIYQSIVAKTVLISMLRSVHRNIIKHTFPKLYKSEIDMFLFSPSTFYILNIADSFTDQTSVKSNITWISFSVILFLGTFLLPIGSEIYMFWICFARFGFRDLFVWLSLIFSVMFIVQALTHIGLKNKIDPDSKLSL